MAYIRVIEQEDADGLLAQIYQNLIEKRGKLAEVHKVQSLHPETIIQHMDLYMTIMFGKSPLKRYQREMMAVIVSSANQCPYCITHHRAALQHFWKDEQKVHTFVSDFESKTLNLSESDLALCHYADTLTRTPNTIDEQIHIKKLKRMSFSDRAILDAALVIAYFNFVNRLVLGLGVHIEDDQGRDYIYD